MRTTQSGKYAAIPGATQGGPVRPTLINQLLPQDIEAERGVLSSFMRDPDLIGRLCHAEGITPQHFANPAHRVIFDEVRFMWNERMKCDFVTVGSSLRSRGKLDEIGGVAFLSDVFSSPAILSYADVYLNSLKEILSVREGIKLCEAYGARLSEPKSGFGILADFKAEVDRLQLGKQLSRLPALRNLSKMLGDNKPAPPPELVAGLLHQGSKCIIGGTSKGRKTFALLDLAISVATGSSWWGMPTKKGRVCYINFEIQEAFFCRRVEDICRVKGVHLGEGALMSWTLRGHGEGSEEMVADLLQVLLREGFALIIFDPVYKMLGDRDENKAGDVASLCNEMERIAVKTGAAIAFGAHYSKGNQSAKEPIDRIGGSGVFARDPDAILTMTAHEQEESFTVDATLRNFAPIAPFVIKWVWPMFHRDDEANPEALKQVKKTGKPFESKYSVDMLLNGLSVLDGESALSLRKRMDQEHGMSKTVFYRFLGELKRIGKAAEKEGLLYRITALRK